MKNKKTKPLPTIYVAGATWVFDRRGALCYKTNNPAIPGFTYATAKQIDGIYAASHQRATHKLLPYPNTRDHRVIDYRNGNIAVGCQTILASEVAKVYRASQKARRARLRK